MQSLPSSCATFWKHTNVYKLITKLDIDTLHSNNWSKNYETVHQCSRAVQFLVIRVVGRNVVFHSLEWIILRRHYDPENELKHYYLESTSWIIDEKIFANAWVRFILRLSFVAIIVLLASIFGQWALSFISPFARLTKLLEYLCNNMSTV